MSDFEPIDISDELHEFAREHSPSERDRHYGCDHQDAPCQVRGAEHRPCPSYWRHLCSQCSAEGVRP
jgi:hypothetical protein